MLSELLRVSRFGLVGLLASLVHILMAGILLSWCPTFHEVVVNFFGYICALSFSLFGHQQFTFRRQARIMRFLSMSLIGLAVNNMVLFSALRLDFSGLYAIIPAVFSAAFVSYLLARRWVF